MSLVVQDLSKKYGTRTVVDHLSFEMNSPGVYALLGTNGAGKNDFYPHDAWHAFTRHRNCHMEWKAA